MSARLHGPLGLKYHPPEKTNTISLFWYISSYLITYVTEIIKVDWKPEVCYANKLVKNLEFRRGCGIGGTQKNALGKSEKVIGALCSRMRILIIAFGSHISSIFEGDKSNGQVFLPKSGKEHIHVYISDLLSSSLEMHKFLAPGRLCD